MNRYEMLSYVAIFAIGMFLTISGLFFNDWEYWILLVLIVAYGTLSKLDALQKDGE